MPSPRSSPALRPTSPLSPGSRAASHFDAIQPPSPRSIHARAGLGQRRPPTGSLHLPSLPRFHPANYPSAHSSAQATPDGMGNSPQPPLSPRTRQFSDAQRHLYLHQREMVCAATRDLSASQMGKPDGPRLAPLGSPGPVTPLELERDEGYLVAGARNAGREQAPTDELVDKLIRQEKTRHWKNQNPSRSNDW